jgi:hypothetical protein
MSQNITNFMRIERNHANTPAADGVKPNTPAASTLSPSVSGFEASQRLNKALTNMPEVRANEVARAKALVADPNYPSPEQMEKVAGVLAANWPREK